VRGGNLAAAWGWAVTGAEVHHNGRSHPPPPSRLRRPVMQARPQITPAQRPGPRPAAPAHSSHRQAPAPTPRRSCTPAPRHCPRQTAGAGRRWQRTLILQGGGCLAGSDACASAAGRHYAAPEYLDKAGVAQHVAREDGRADNWAGAAQLAAGGRKQPPGWMGTGEAGPPGVAGGSSGGGGRAGGGQQAGGRGGRGAAQPPLASAGRRALGSRPALAQALGGRSTARRRLPSQRRWRCRPGRGPPAPACGGAHLAR
jgi:hypothetical protein